MHERVQKYALKTSLGMLNPSGSVVTVYPNAIKQINTLNDYYLGVKQVSFMLTDFLTFFFFIKQRISSTHIRQSKF